MKRLLRIIAVYATLFLLLSVLLTVFSKKDLLTDHQAKAFVTAFANSDLVIREEPADERRVVVINCEQNKGRHFSTVVLGSSRVMQIGNYTGFSNCLNLGVSGCTLQDLETIVGLIREHRITADTLIVDFNPWYLLAEADIRYKHFQTEYRWKQTAVTVLTFDHSAGDFRTFLRQAFTDDALYRKAVKADLAANSFLKFSDGSIREKRASAAERGQRIQAFVNGFYLMKGLHGLDTKRFSEFTGLVHSLSRKSVVVINLSPFHPQLYSTNKQDPRIRNIALSEQWVRRLEGPDIRITGSFDPTVFGLTDRDFLDGLHLLEEHVRKIYGR